MEKSWNLEQKTLVSELIQGREMAKQLRVQFRTKSSSETTETLLHRILASYEKALVILRWGGSMGQTQTAAGVTAGFPGSPISVNGSLESDEFDKCLKDHRDPNDVSKKRKILPRWTDQVRVTSETGLEGPHDDGYSWRKYGQKDILGAKYPRSYYRCTFRLTQDCWATRQVQRSDEDPNVFEITYRGKHTCSHATNLAPAPSSPEKQDNNGNQQDPQPLGFLGNTGSSLRVVTEELENKEMSHESYPFTFPSTSFGCIKSENSNFSLPTIDNSTLLGSFSPSFLSPATPESNFHSVSPFQNGNFKGAQNIPHSESDLTHEIISANTSATSSPILDLDFSLDPAEIGHFPFDSSSFFS